MPESYQPGQRVRKYGQNHQISENRYAWVQCEIGKFLILVGEDEGHGQDVVLYHPKPGRLPDVAIKLTDLTEPELLAMKELFDSAFEWALPVVTRRDKEAEDAWNEGDDSHVRNYRPAPTVVYRKRPVSEHGEGVHQRSSGVPEGSGGEPDGDPGGVRGAGDVVPEPVQVQGESEDDGSTAD
jgi:hypothetical protein